MAEPIEMDVAGSEDEDVEVRVEIPSGTLDQTKPSGEGSSPAKEMKTGKEGPSRSRVVAQDIASTVQKTFQSSGHPFAAVFHILPKIFALFVYLLASFFDDLFVFVFVLLVLVLSVDFWIVKNISGRLLVGLRWWNETATNTWVFESAPSDRQVNTVDARTFWFGLYGCELIWIILLVIALLKINIQWMLGVIIALVLNGTNIYCYLVCEKNARNQLSAVSSFATSAVASAFARQWTK